MSNGNDDYSPGGVKVLKGLEAIRRRPGMYVGDVYDGAGLHNLAFLLAEHSIEERSARGCDEVRVTLEADGSLVFEDNGAGLPTDIDPLSGMLRAEMIMTQMMAGAASYWQLAVINALSSRLDLNFWSEGHEYAASFADGVATSPVRPMGRGRRAAGLRVAFWPSPVIFPKTSFDYGVLRHRLRELAILHPGVRIVLTELRKSDPYCEEMIYERHT